MQQPAPSPVDGAGPQPAVSRATLSDVALLAGVSGKTVSRVVSGHPNVSDETRERVMAAVRLLRFRPNHIARDLRRGAVSTTVGFVIGDLKNHFYGLVADGVERVLAEHALTMVLASTRDDAATEQAIVSTMLERRVLALLLVPSASDQSYLDAERHLGTPIVCVDRPPRNLVADSVVIDNRKGAAEGVRALIAAGHRRIGFVGSAPGSYTHEERLAGYRDALMQAGIERDPRWERDDAPDLASSERATRDLLALNSPPTAIFSGNNRASSGVVVALHNQPVPVAFIGFDDFDLAGALNMSVVAHDPGEMGKASARIALRRLGHLTGETSQLTLPTHLIARGSGEIPPPAA